MDINRWHQCQDWKLTLSALYVRIAHHRLCGLFLHSLSCVIPLVPPRFADSHNARFANKQPTETFWRFIIRFNVVESLRLCLSFSHLGYICDEHSFPQWQLIYSHSLTLPLSLCLKMERVDSSTLKTFPYWKIPGSIATVSKTLITDTPSMNV